MPLGLEGIHGGLETFCRRLDWVSDSKRLFYRLKKGIYKKKAISYQLGKNDRIRCGADMPLLCYLSRNLAFFLVLALCRFTCQFSMPLSPFGDAYKLEKRVANFFIILFVYDIFMIFYSH